MSRIAHKAKERGSRCRDARATSSCFLEIIRNRAVARIRRGRRFGIQKAIGKRCRAKRRRAKRKPLCAKRTRKLQFAVKETDQILHEKCIARLPRDGRKVVCRSYENAFVAEFLEFVFVTRS